MLNTTVHLPNKALLLDTKTNNCLESSCYKFAISTYYSKGRSSKFVKNGNISTPGNKLPKCNCFCMAIICGCGGGVLKLDLN